MKGGGIVQFQASIPIYLQIADLIEMWILQGRLERGMQVPSVRQLALELQVNPNTVQKAFLELESAGVIITKRATGRFITDDLAKLEQMRQKILSERTSDFIKTMREFGLDDDAILALVAENADATKEGL